MKESSVHNQNELHTNSGGGFYMLNLLKKRLKNEKGLTLIELLAVIVILAIVAAIAIPAIGNIIDNSRYKSAKADAIMILEGANIYFTDNPSEQHVTIEELNDTGYIENLGTFKDNLDGEVTKDTNNDNKLTLNGTATLSNGKTITFTDATIEQISEDSRSAKEAFGDGDSATIPSSPGQSGGNE